MLIPVEEITYAPLLRVRVLNALLKGARIAVVVSVGITRALWAGLVLVCMMLCRVSIWAARATAQRIQK